MDEELMANVCYEYEIMTGMFMMFMPEGIRRRFDPDEIWTQEEFDKIDECANKSIRMKRLKNEVGNMLDEFLTSRDTPEE